MKDGSQVITFVVDPGAQGGYAVCFGGLRAITLHNLETFQDLLEHVDELQQLHKGYLRCVLEDVPSYTGRDIPSYTSFKLGKNVGQLEGMFRALRIPVEFISPRKWQSKFTGLKGLTGGPRKRALRDHAARLYPLLKPTLKTADALLMAHYHFS